MFPRPALLVPAMLVFGSAAKIAGQSSSDLVAGFFGAALDNLNLARSLLPADFFVVSTLQQGGQLAHALLEGRDTSYTAEYIDSNKDHASFIPILVNDCLHGFARVDGERAEALIKQSLIPTSYPLQQHIANHFSLRQYRFSGMLFGQFVDRLFREDFKEKLSPLLHDTDSQLPQCAQHERLLEQTVRAYAATVPSRTPPSSMRAFS